MLYREHCFVDCPCVCINLLSAYYLPRTNENSYLFHVNLMQKSGSGKLSSSGEVQNIIVGADKKKLKAAKLHPIPLVYFF